MSPALAQARVETLVAAARSLVTNAEGTFEPSEGLTAELAAASGLSPESVRWALEHALEWRASSDDAKTLVAGAGERHDAGPLVVVLAANVTTAALRALACAVARAEEVVVYPSSRDPVLARHLVARAGLRGLHLVERRDDLPVDDPRAHVVLYGSAETARTLAPHVKGTLEVHGPGLGLALLTDDSTLDHVASLAEDIAAFDQRGCLSPRLALHVGDPHRGRELAEALFRALDHLGAVRPLGTLDESERHTRTLALEAARTFGDVWATARAAVVHEESAPPNPAASARTLTVHTVPSLEAGRAWIAAWAPRISALGAHDPVLRASFLPEFSLRRSALGAMQRPAFDGPVDRRPHGPEGFVSR